MEDNKKKFIEVFDLSTKEGLEGYNKQLNQLENSDLGILKLFGIDGNDVIDRLRKIGNAIYENNKKEEEEETPKFTRPSDLLDVDKKLQIHKIVQEYVDTMVKPFNNGKLTENQINDAYAGLFEFACWVMNR